MSGYAGPVTSWRPGTPPETAARRSALLAAARGFFAEREILEVDVPVLTPAAVSDPHIDSMRVCSDLAGGRTLYLSTSPEYPMKRLLAAGYPDIYSIARAFRDGELGRCHEPEFTLIEWYRHGFALEAMAGETCALIARLAGRPELTKTARTWRYADAFSASLNVDITAVPTDELRRIAAADRELSAALGSDRDAWLNLLLSQQVIPGFPDKALTVLTHYPASQAALARLDPADPTTALRFEVFFGRLELANGYVELTDASAQRERFALEIAARRSKGRHDGPVDRRLLAALAAGLPDCAGVALGLERVHMLADGHASIRDVITFGFGDRA